MQRVSRTLTNGILTVAATVLASACAGDAAGVNGNSSTQIAFSTATGVGASLAAAPITNGGHTLDLTDVIVTVSRAELKRAQSDACPGDDDNDDHPAAAASTASCGELKIGPVNVSLPLDGTLTSIPANAIPAGTYREFELRISQVELKGTFDGTAFDDTIPVRARTELEFSTPLVVTDGTPTAVTVNVPATNWLVNPDGSIVDPTKLTDSQRALLRQRITASVKAFEDRDHDGKDDHHEGHGGDGH